MPTKQSNLMAITLDTYIPDELMYSSELGNLTYSTSDYDRLLLDVYRTDDYTSLYTATLFLAEGVVTFYDLRSLIEQYMLSNGLSYFEFVVEAQNEGGEEASITKFMVLFCSFTPSIEAPLFASRYFLTTLTAKELATERDEYLYAFHNKGDTLTTFLHIVYRTVNGEVKRERFEESRSAAATGVASYLIRYEDIVLYVWSDEFKELISLNYQLNDRMFVFYPRRRPTDTPFTFRNAFNCWDYYYLEGSTNVKTSAEKSEAICGGIVQHYDKQSKQLFEVKTAPMRTEAAEWLAQFLLSPCIYRGSNNDEQRIIIEDFTHEITDDDSGQHKIEFTWRYAKANKQALMLPRENNPNIFTKQFNEPFQ